MQTNDDTETIIKTGISIEEKVAFLQQPASYPYPVKEVIVKETHMSWVFLADDFVYKLKKPVQYSSFDHSTLTSRFINSVEEIGINKELARDVYIEVVPLVINENGSLQLKGKGEAVDWLVKMKRIPEQYMLDNVIEHDCVNEQRLQQALSLLIKFYKSSPPTPITVSAFIRKLESQVAFNYERPRYFIFLGDRGVHEGKSPVISSHFGCHASECPGVESSSR